MLYPIELIYRNENKFKQRYRKAILKCDLFPFGEQAAGIKNRVMPCISVYIGN